MREALLEYVDELTPAEAPPFEYVERTARQRRHRRRVVLAAVAAVVVVIGGVAATVGLPRAAEEPAGPEKTTNFLDDGPPPSRFQVGPTVMVLQGEIGVMSATQVPDHPSMLMVSVGPGMGAPEPCVPSTVVRILSQDNESVRIAAYRYTAVAEQPETRHCRPSMGAIAVDVDLRSPLGDRTVYAGSSGERAVLN
jgi:hypothetical protein